MYGLEQRAVIRSVLDEASHGGHRNGLRDVRAVKANVDYQVCYFEGCSLRMMSGGGVLRRKGERGQGLREGRLRVCIVMCEYAG
eukprot:496938-Rhodomonas_salina.2